MGRCFLGGGGVRGYFCPSTVYVHIPKYLALRLTEYLRSKFYQVPTVQDTILIIEEYPRGLALCDLALSQYSECGSPPQLLKISFFFRRRIANTINFSTSTLFFCIKLILNRNTISRNTSTAFLILNSTCDISYVCNCVF